MCTRKSNNRMQGQIGRFLFICLSFFTILNQTNLYGAYLRKVPIQVQQPDGTVLDLFATGDEYYNWVHDENGYTVVRDPQTGFVEYAVLQNEELAASGYKVDKVDPASVGLSPNINIPASKMKEINFKNRLIAENAPFAADDLPFPAPTIGSINNIVVFIRFSGESEFTDAVSTYNNMFNSSAAGYNSLYNYYQEASYNQLSITSTIYPIPPGATVVSFQDSHVRNYFRPYNASTNPIGYSGDTQRRDREFALLRAAVNAISASVPPGLNVDGDSDGLVDNVCFIVYGSPGGWSDLLWPHMWSLYTSPYVYINGKRVYTFNFQLQTSLASSGVGVLCHEMFHSLGAPDLYHYYYGTSLYPVYQWDLMEWDMNPPQHMGAYMKYRYGDWISSIPEIKVNGLYSLNPLTSATNNCYKIKSPNSTTEYYVLEYRRDTGPFESSVPGSGLLVYRINTTFDGQGNADYDPPTTLDEVYIYRPDGTTASNGNPSIANFSSEAGRTAINNSTNPSPFLSNGNPGGLEIWGVTSAGSTISFNYAGVKVLYPTASGVNWNRGSNQTITWKGYSGANVKIELYKGGVLNLTIIASTPNDGSYSWTVPAGQALGNDYKIKITNTANAAQYDESNNDFTISRNERVTYPNANGVKWSRGSTYNITWTGYTDPNVKIQLWKGGVLNLTIIASTPNDGSHSWTVPAGQTLGTDYKIKIISTSFPAKNDFSDNDFTILRSEQVTYPTAINVSWCQGLSYTITWTGFSDTNVKIDLYKASLWNRTIIGTTPNDGSYSWTVPVTQTVGNDYKIKVTSKSNTSNNDFSDNDFTISSEATLFQEHFESNFPGTRWLAGDANSTNGYDYWDDMSVSAGGRAWDGTKSVYCAGISDISGQQYDNYMSAYFQMSSGVNVAAYTNVQLKFKVYVDSESGYDYLYRYFSSDGVNWTLSSSWTGPFGTWMEYTVNCLNFTTYWSKFVFYSDYSVHTYEGAYVDAIEILGTPATSPVLSKDGITEPHEIILEGLVCDDVVQAPKEIENQNQLIPSVFNLTQNYPNPFNSNTVIEYDIPEPVHVSLTVFNALGEEVATLLNTDEKPGFHQIIWNGKDNSGIEVSSGVYFYILETDKQRFVKKMILVR